MCICAHIHKDQYRYTAGKFPTPAQGEMEKLVDGPHVIPGGVKLWRDFFSIFNVISLIRRLSVYLFDSDKRGKTPNYFQKCASASREATVLAR